MRPALKRRPRPVASGCPVSRLPLRSESWRNSSCALGHSEGARGADGILILAIGTCVPFKKTSSWKPSV
eukprot:1309527-Pyramimonas_sp.AAC.1